MFQHIPLFENELFHVSVYNGLLSSDMSKLKQKNEAMTQTSTTLTPQSEENDSVHIKSEPEIVKPIYQPIRNHQRVRERIKKLRKKHHQKFLEKVQK